MKTRLHKRPHRFGLMKTTGALHWIGRAREIPALMLASLWLLGVLFAPLTHELLHSHLGTHTHQGDGAIGFASAVHAHDDGVPHIDEAGPQVQERAGAPHLHDLLALNTHAPGWVMPIGVLIGEAEGPADLDDALSAPRLPSLIARGPPTHT